MIDKEEVRKRINSFFGKKNKIKELRGDLTITKLSENIDIDQGQLSKQINGLDNMYIYRLVQIAEELGYKPADLLPAEWQSQYTESSSSQINNESLKYLKEVITDFRKLLKNYKINMSIEDETDIAISLFEETYKLPPEERAASLEQLISFFIKTRQNIISKSSNAS